MTLPDFVSALTAPKARQISAAPYRDRVVHHAPVNVLEPIYERTFGFAQSVRQARSGDCEGICRCHCNSTRSGHTSW
jgi:hypothetical protein